LRFLSLLSGTPELGFPLDDEMMEAVLRNAWFDSRGFREMIAETARRFEGPRVVELIRDVLRSTDACGI
jgi:hypothetical protein